MGKKKKSFYFTHEIVEEFAEKENLPTKDVELILKKFIDALRDEAKKPEAIYLTIEGLGTLYTTLTGVNYETKLNNEYLERLEKKKQTEIINKKTEYALRKKKFLEEKKKVLVEEIGRLKSNNKHTILHLRKIFNPNGIKNV